MVDIPTGTDPVSVGIGVIVSSAGQKQADITKKLEKLPVWNDPAGLQQVAAGLPRGGAGGKYAYWGTQRQIINDRIAELNSQGPRIGPTPGTEPPSDIFGRGIAGEQAPSPVFKLPGGAVGPIFGMTIPRGIKDIFGGTNTAKVIGVAKSTVEKIPKAAGKIGKAVTGGRAIGTVVGTEIGRQIISEVAERSREQWEKDIAKLNKQQAAAQKQAMARGAAARAARGEPPLQTAAEKERAAAAADRRAAAREREYEKAQDRADKAIERARTRGEAVSKKTLEVIDKAEQDLAKIEARGPRTYPVPVLKVPPGPRQKFVFALASLFGEYLHARIEKNRIPGRRSSGGFTEEPSTVFPEAPAYDFTGADYSSMSFAAQSATAARTRAATRTRACKSDTPKRKKGVCRSGYFKESPSRTTYKVWSTRKC